MCDLEGPLNMIQIVLYWLWSRCVRVNKFAVFSIHKRSIIDYVHFYPAMLRIARFMRLRVICPSVLRLSVTFRYRDHICWNTSKIISRPNSLRLRLDDPVQQEHPKIRVQ